MDKLILKEGKFFRGAEIVPLEFGNWEQIKLIKEKQERLSAINGEGMPVDVWVEEITTYQAQTDFRCIQCDKFVYIESEVDNEDDKDSLLGTHSCWHCHAKYEILKNDEGDFVVKVKPKK